MSLVLEAVTFGYPGRSRTVLEGASLKIPTGSSCAVVAASGTGKTTLLALVGGLLTPVSGTIDTGTGQSERHRRNDVSWIFQSPATLPRRTALDNVALTPLAQGCGRDEACVRARAALHQVGLGDYAETPVRKLSGGQAQRVAIARALLSRPRTLLADEPTASLDYETGAEVVRQLKAAMEDAALLVATHDMRIATMMDVAVTIDAGRLVPLELT